LAKNWIHLVFSTKLRRRCIDADIQPQLHAYQAGILQHIQSPALQIGGIDDHVHILFQLSKNLALAKAVEEVKRSSSKWIKDQHSRYQDFAWQHGYAAFSVSNSNLQQVADYIRHQAEHHRQFDFQKELLLILQKHQVEYDERYLWD
jgi:REP element-mobilizing transposase RayT